MSWTVLVEILAPAGAQIIVLDPALETDLVPGPSVTHYLPPVTAPTFVSASTRIEGPPTSTSVVPKPSGVTAGDLMIASIGIALNSATNTFSTVPAGWTQIDNLTPGANQSRLAVYWKIATSSEPASYTWGVASTTENWASGIVVFRGVDAGNPIGMHNPRAVAASVTATTNSITPPGNKYAVIAVFATDASNANGAGLIQPSAGTVTGTEAFSVQETTNLMSTELQYYMQNTAAPITMAAHRSVGDACDWSTVILAISPVSTRSTSLMAATVQEVAQTLTRKMTAGHYILTPAREAHGAQDIQFTIGQLTIGMYPDVNLFPGLDVFPEQEAEIIGRSVRAIRERPLLRLHAIIKTPHGNYYRWGVDEANVEDVLADETHSSTMPGGFENCQTTLSRFPEHDYNDLVEFSTITIQGAGDMVAWQGRLEQLPRTSGDDIALVPAAVGWQAALTDNQSVRALYSDIDMTKWHDMSQGRRDELQLAGMDADGSSMVTDSGTGYSAIETTLDGAFTRYRVSEAWYDSNGIPIGSIYYSWLKSPNITLPDANWYWFAAGTPKDSAWAATADTDANRASSTPGSATFAFTGGNKIFALLTLQYRAAMAIDEPFTVYWPAAAVYGNYGLTKRGSSDLVTAQGYYASDIVQHALSTWAPKLSTVRAGASTISPSSFVVPQAAFLDPTNVSEIIKLVSQYDLQDWYVDEGPTFWWHPRGERGRKWRARVGPARLSEAGPQVDRIWNNVVVQYKDRTGNTLTVGPPGFIADDVDVSLNDTDTQNPATAAGLTRCTLITLGTNTLAGAVKIGQAFLTAQKTLSTAGEATLVGHVEDDHGVLWPAWAVRPGDQISFTDAHDPSYRRIVQTSWSNSSLTQQITLDSPPQSLQAYLERMGDTEATIGV